MPRPRLGRDSDVAATPEHRARPDARTPEDRQKRKAARRTIHYELTRPSHTTAAFNSLTIIFSASRASRMLRSAASSTGAPPAVVEMTAARSSLRLEYVAASIAAMARSQRSSASTCGDARLLRGGAPVVSAEAPRRRRGVTATLSPQTRSHLSARAADVRLEVLDAI